MAEGNWYASSAHDPYRDPELAERYRRSDAWSGFPLALLIGPVCLFVWGMEDGIFEHGIVWNWPVAPRLKDVEYAVEDREMSELLPRRMSIPVKNVVDIPSQLMLMKA